MRILGSLAVIAIGVILASELPSVLASPCATDSQKYLIRNQEAGLYITVPVPKAKRAIVTLEALRSDQKNQQFCFIIRRRWDGPLLETNIALDNDDYTLVLDVKGANPAPGTSVVAHPKSSRNPANQM